MNKNICVALYARVSSDQQAKRNTIDSQISAVEERIQSDGCMLVDDLRFIDDGCSGATLIRPALERLRDCAASGLIDRLYVLSPDRLSRKYAYQALLMDELAGAGVETIFLNHAHGTTPEENLLLQVQGVIAEYERAKIIERHRRGKLYRAKSGAINVLSGAPYGFNYIRKQPDGEMAKYAINFQEATVVKRIFNWVGKDRLTLGEVVRRLADANIKTKTGKETWDRSTIWGMLQNPAYMGKAAFGKTKSGSLLPRVRPQKHSREQPNRPVSTYKTSRKDWIEIDVPAIISEELFEAVQEQLEENRKLARQRKRGAAYLLQGLTVCGHCRYAFYGKPVSKKSAKGKRTYAYYRCIGTDAYRFGGHRICENKQVRTTALEDIVWQQVVQLLQNPARLKDEYNRRLGELEKSEKQRFDGKTLEKQIKKLQQGVSRLIDSYTDGLIEKDEFEPKMKQVKTKIKHLKGQLNEAQSVESEQFELCLIVNRLDSFAESVCSKLNDVDFQKKREIIRTLVKRIEIYQEEVVVVFRTEPSDGNSGNMPPAGENPDRNSKSMQHCTSVVY